jgi:hypothetical protein
MMEIVHILAGAYLCFIGMLMETSNILSFALFRAAPFLLGVTVLVAALHPFIGAYL